MKTVGDDQEFRRLESVEIDGLVIPAKSILWDGIEPIRPHKGTVTVTLLVREQFSIHYRSLK